MAIAGRPLVEDCEGCARINPSHQQECSAFKSPRAMWRYGTVCWGFTRDQQQVARAEGDIELYAVDKNGQGDVV